jgi:hypothetical protein
MKFILNRNYFLQVFLTFALTLSFSCEKSVSLNNPFDEDVVIPPPYKLWVSKINDSLALIRWKSDIVFTSEIVKNNIFTIVEYNKLGAFSLQPPIIIIDTIKEITSFGLVSAEGFFYSTLVRGQFITGEAYDFSIRFLAGTKTSNSVIVFSNVVPYNE